MSQQSPNNSMHAAHSPILNGHVIKDCPKLYLVDWLSHNNHTENRDQEITGINIITHTISVTADIPICTSIEGHKSSHE